MKNSNKDKNEYYIDSMTNEDTEKYGIDSSEFGIFDSNTGVCIFYGTEAECINYLESLTKAADIIETSITDNNTTNPYEQGKIDAVTGYDKRDNYTGQDLEDYIDGFNEGRKEMIDAAACDKNNFYGYAKIISPTANNAGKIVKILNHDPLTDICTYELEDGTTNVLPYDSFELIDTPVIDSENGDSMDIPTSTTISGDTVADTTIVNEFEDLYDSNNAIAIAKKYINDKHNFMWPDSIYITPETNSAINEIFEMDVAVGNYVLTSVTDNSGVIEACYYNEDLDTCLYISQEELITLLNLCLIDINKDKNAIAEAKPLLPTTFFVPKAFTTSLLEHPLSVVPEDVELSDRFLSSALPGTYQLVKVDGDYLVYDNLNVVKPLILSGTEEAFREAIKRQLLLPRGTWGNSQQ